MTPCLQTYDITIIPTILLVCWMLAAAACALLAIANMGHLYAPIIVAAGFCMVCFVESADGLPRYLAHGGEGNSQLGSLDGDVGG